jgi:chromosome segregation ATPase
MPLFGDESPTNAGVAAGGVLGVVLAVLYAIDRLVAARAKLRQDGAAAGKAEAEVRVAEADADDRAIKQHVALNRVLMTRTQRLQDQLDEQRSEVIDFKTQLETLRAHHAECEERAVKQAERIAHLEKLCGEQQQQIDLLLRITPPPPVPPSPKG